VRDIDAKLRQELVSASDTTYSVRKQCELLGVNRSSLYYEPHPREALSEENVELVMSRIDYWNTYMCYLGARKILDKLVVDDGFERLSLETVKKLMSEMGICAVYPHQNTSAGSKNSIKLPYLLKNMAIWLPNMAWSIDITYIKMHRSHMYLTAIIDWFSRYLLGWELSDSLESAPVLSCVERTIHSHGEPIVINSDQGSQFTSWDYIELLADYRIKQSMDGKGRWQDNRRIERWFRSLKVENIYITEYQAPRELRLGIGDYVQQYNFERPHASLRYARPATFHNSFFPFD